MSLRRMSRSVFYWQIRSIDSICIPAVRLRIFNCAAFLRTADMAENHEKSQGTAYPEGMKKSLKSKINASKKLHYLIERSGHIHICVWNSISVISGCTGYITIPKIMILGIVVRLPALSRPSAVTSPLFVTPISWLCVATVDVSFSISAMKVWAY